MSEEDLTNYKTYISDLDITKYIVLDNESNYWYSAEYVDKMLKKQDKEIERLNNIINELEKSKEKQINDYEILILKIERYLNCYQYFLETQEENNKKIANMIHEFETKDSDK